MSRSDVTRLQHSVPVYSDLTNYRAPKTYGETHYSRMLVEDVVNGLLPYRVSQTADNSAVLEPASREAERLVAEGLGRDQHWRLSEAVFDFLRQAAQTLLVFGEVPYEIVYLSETESGRVVGFDLSFIPPWSLSQKNNGWVQTVPEDYAQPFQTPSRIELPSNSVVHLRLPPSIGRYFPRMMEDLDLHGRHLYPEFGIPVAGSTTTDCGFDFGEWHRCQQIALAQATQECGWNGRNSFSEVITEYYFLYRFLKFEQFKLQLRTSILAQLNEVLRIAGARIGFTGQIVLHGLPNSAQIEQSMRELESGEVSFADVMKPYLRY